MYSNDNSYEIKIQPSNYRPNSWDLVKVRREGVEYATVRHMERQVLTHVERIDANTYKVVKTGEVKEYNQMGDKAKQNAKRIALKRTFRELRGLIRANFVNDGSPGQNAQLFITLTYRENMTDEKRLLTDYNKFIKRLEYAYSEHRFLYVTVMEPQGRGAWHVHMLLKSLNHDILWLENDDIARIWSHGFTKTQRLKSNDVGAYYTAYFTCLIAETKENKTSEETLAEEEVITRWNDLIEHDKELTKKEKKASRLDFYPKGMRFYRTSQNVVRPTERTEYAFELADDGYKEVYTRSFDIVRNEVTVNQETMNLEKVQEMLNRIHHATFRKDNDSEKE